MATGARDRRHECVAPRPLAEISTRERNLSSRERALLISQNLLAALSGAVAKSERARSSPRAAAGRSPAVVALVLRGEALVRRRRLHHRDEARPAAAKRARALLTLS